MCQTRRADRSSTYRATAGGRYLVYKEHHIPNSTSEIRAIETTASGIHLAKRHTSRRLAFGGLVSIDGPQIVNHGRHAWLFVSRRRYADCSYYTQVWKARSIARRFTPVGGTPNRPGYFDINRRDGENFCGPGGADLINDGGTWRIAFQAWEHGVHATGGVQTGWTGRVRWAPSTGLPSMAGLP